MTAPEKRSTFACGVCNQAITPPLALLPTSIGVSPSHGTPLLPRGYYLHADDAGERYYTGSAGCVLINAEDVVATKPHPDADRHEGCCGPDGVNGPNLVCSHGHEVGTLRGDCWMPHAVVLVPSVVSRGS